MNKYFQNTDFDNGEADFEPDHDYLEGECPCCGAVFGMDEIVQGLCFSCGWSLEEFQNPEYDEAD